MISFTAPRWLISLYYYIYFILGKGELKLNIWESQGEIYQLIITYFIWQFRVSLFDNLMCDNLITFCKLISKL